MQNGIDYDIIEEDINTQEAAVDYLNVLVMYDISDNKRRTKLAKLLLGYGVRIQKSVFQCELTSDKYNKMCRQIRPHIHEEDALNIFKLNKMVTTISYGTTLESHRQSHYFV